MEEQKPALLRDESPTEELFSSFKRRGKAFFPVGRAFRILWSEPAGDWRSDASGSTYTITRFGEVVHSKVRLFVVTFEGDTYCSALPVTTYSNRGVAKVSVNKSEHSVIYSGKREPDLLPGEKPRRGESPMQPFAIRVTADDPGSKLDPASRIHYRQIYTIHHNLKVANFGQVHPHSLVYFHNQFKNVWAAISNSLDASSSAMSTHRAVHPVAGLPQHRTIFVSHQYNPTERPSIDHQLMGPHENLESLQKKIFHLLATGHSAAQIVNIIMSAKSDDREDMLRTPTDAAVD